MILQAGRDVNVTFGPADHSTGPRMRSPQRIAITVVAVIAVAATTAFVTAYLRGALDRTSAGSHSPMNTNIAAASPSSSRPHSSVKSPEPRPDTSIGEPEPA
ncbi:hypothetical protein ACWEFJ_33600 [Actinosynnema sp. NPDC004786]